jgi:hypothetical protein
MNYFKEDTNNTFKMISSGDIFMPDNNHKRFPPAYLYSLIILAALLVLAGCSAPPVTNIPMSTTTPAVAATCSADTGVCPVIIPTSIRINASPSTYSPLMSSTPGIRLTPNVSGFNPAEAEFAWNASYGHFLSWELPDHTVRSLSQPVVNHGETIYWSFTNPVSPARDPVTISVTARNVSQGRVLGSSELSLGWEGNFTVIVQNTR